MDDKNKLKIYIASSVGIDYFFFLGKTLSESGNKVESIFLISEKEYRTLAKKSGIKKIYLRIKMYIFYPIYLMYKAITSPRNSIFIVTSNTFYAPIVTKMSVFWKKTKVFHLLYDLFPDAIEVAGSIKQNGRVANLIGQLSKWNFKFCDGTVYLGNFLKQHAEVRWGKSIQSKVIHISTDLSLYDNEFIQLNNYEKLIIHYGGQLGHLHDAISIIECIKFVLKSDIKNRIEFNFYVSGAQAELLKKSLENFPIKIIAAVDSKIWRQDIKSFHIGLVTLSPGGASVCLPSKTYGMMAGGLSILAVCPRWSDLANLVTSNNAGWVVSNSQCETLLNELNNRNDYFKNINTIRNSDEIKIEFYNTLKNILENINELKEKRWNAFNNVRTNYNVTILNEQWISLILGKKLNEN